MRRLADRRLLRRGLAFVLTLAIGIAIPQAIALASHQFTDVPNTNSFHNHIDAIADAGITTGCAVGKYCPKDFVTREQMAAFLNRLGALGPGTTPRVNAATAETANHATSADTAADADTLDGLDSTDLLDGFGFGELYSSELVGASGGSPYLLECPEGSVATGLQGERSEFVTFIGHLSVECTPLAMETFLFAFGEPTQTEDVGDTTAVPFSIQCADNAVMTGIVGQVSNLNLWPVQLSIECTPVGGVASADTVTVEGTPMGVLGASAFSRSCPAGKVVTGLGPAGAGAFVDSIRLQCH